MHEPHSPDTRLPSDDMASKLERLKQLSPDSLRTEWRRYYRSEPPPRIGRDLMIRAVAHKMQEQALGGLKGPVKRKLKSLMESVGSGKPAGVAGSAVLKPGMRLMREWRGQRYDVLILDSGFEFMGRTYQSLTAIAGEITGTHWSGPRFFGLKKANEGYGTWPMCSIGRGSFVMTRKNIAAVRCAIYSRKSSEDGLEQEFNSLHAQREACEAYIQSQKHEGWTALPQHYDDGGISGATMNRPALQRLLEDIRSGKVDTIVVYKIDRLTRSLADFAKMVELFDERGITFVSVTQQFNTTTSMGRLTLNVLLSFAQFEREVTGERIRDKIAASKKKGMWMGGNVPLGYDAKDRKLIVNEKEAETVRYIFHRYVELGSVPKPPGRTPG